MRWRQLADRAENLRKFVKISLVGKYTGLEDAYASVIKVGLMSILDRFQLLFYEAYKFYF